MLREAFRYLAVALVALCTACIGDQQSQCLDRYALRVVVVNNAGQQIDNPREAGSVTLYLFDKDKRYVDSVRIPEEQVEAGTPVEITRREKGEEFWVVAWSNLNGSQSVTRLSEGVAMSDAFVTLSRDGGGEYAVSPDDIFFGIKRISHAPAKSTQETHEINISRATARMNIVVKGLDPQYREEYSFRVTDAKRDAYDFNGRLKGEEVMYRGAGVFNALGQYVTRDALRVLPVEGGDRLTVSVMRGDNPIASVSANKEGIPISPVAGATENVLIDLTKAQIAVHIITTDWSETYEWREW